MMHQVFDRFGLPIFMADPPREHSWIEHGAMRALGIFGLGAAALSLSPVLLPHVLPDPQGWVATAASEAFNFCGSGIPRGLAGGLHGIWSTVGAGSLVSGGLLTVASAAALVVGGMWLGNYLDKRATPGAFPWGAAVRWGCLATSMLIAAPMVLSGISMGLIFFSSLLAAPGLMHLASGIGSLGAAGAMSGTNMAMGSAGMGLIHAVTCGLPLGLGFLLKDAHPSPKMTLHVPLLNRGRVMPRPLSQPVLAG